jgi:hypothetical protein
MKPWRIVGSLCLCVVIGAGVWLYKWRSAEPRRAALSAVSEFEKALESNNPASLLQTVVLPAAIQNRTTAEQVEFLTKALRDEISPEGLAALSRNGSYGPLQQIFPNESKGWTSQAGVNPESCVAFRMEKAGLRAEIVLFHEGQSYRVLRCNNVKQMAEPNPSRG